MNADVVSLAGFQRRAELVADSPKDERVWDRVERTQKILTSGGFASNYARSDAWSDAAEAFLQYMDNEWPIEKDNLCRSDTIAEYAATLYATGAFDPITTKKSLEVQNAILEAFDKPKFSRSLANFRLQTQALIDLMFAPNQGPI